MALVIGMYIGDALYFDETKATLESVAGPTRFKLKVHGAAIDSVYEIDGSGTAEILPEVRVSAAPTHQPNWAKLVIEAPRRIKVRREALMKRDKERARA